MNLYDFKFLVEEIINIKIEVNRELLKTYKKGESIFLRTKLQQKLTELFEIL